MRAPEFSPSSKRFTYVSTIEPRKRHQTVLDAFERLWSQGRDVELMFIGKAGTEAAERLDRLARLAEVDTRFSWYKECNDAQLRELVTSSRATIFASEAEGFGLPPLESLALGVPVIAPERLPSLSMLPRFGQVRLETVSAAAIAEAVCALLDDEFAARKFAEIKELEVPTWRGLSEFLHHAIAKSSDICGGTRSRGQ